MRWITFIILGIVTLVCQTTIAQAITIHETIRPNWMLVLAVFYALWGPWPEVAIGAWFLGLAVDLQSLPVDGRIGLYAFTFGGAAWLITRIRSVFWREHAVTQFVLTLVVTMIIEVLVALYRHWGAFDGISKAGFFLPAVFTALYTAAFAPYLHWILLRLWRWTGLKPPARKPGRG